MALAAGARLGPYEIIDPLGAGGMGEVYRARDTRLDRVVAIKVLPREAGQPGARERLRREARAISRLSHPHICALHDIGEADGVEFLVMEHLDGETLADRLAAGPLPVEEAARYAVQVAAALAEAHRQGVIHRDLKPANIMLTRAGVKVLDFGLAKIWQARGDEWTGTPTGTVDLTAEGTLIGTLPYMAPEQLEGRPVDARTDIFAFGVTLYEMVTGSRPFRGDSRASLIAAIMTSEPEPLAALRPLAPPLLDRAVRRCLAKKPEARWQAVQDLEAELTFISETVRHPARGLPGLARPLRALAAVPRRRFAMPAALVGAAALAGLLAAAAGLRWPASSSAIDSLAVLPFENASEDADAEYLVDGITESLIEQMSRVPALRVMARASVFRFKGADPLEAGRSLGVRAVVTGTVSRRADQISISAELVDSSTGARLWGRRYDRPFADLLGVQDRITADISDGLRLRLTGDQKRTLSRHGTDNAAAYELFLKGRFLLTRNTEQDDLEARRLFQQALDEDRGFVDAHLGVVSTYARAAGNGYAPPAEVWPEADEEVRRALDLDPDNVSARCSLANRRFLYDWDWAGAEREYRELSAEPGLLLGTQFHPIVLFAWARGRADDAVALMERAVRVDPRNLESRIMHADSLARAGRLEVAIEQYRTIARDEPSDPSPLFGLAEALKQRGDLPGAIDALRRAYELSGEGHGSRALASARTEADYENAEVAVARARLGELEALATERYVSPLDLARRYAQVGEREKAFAGLEAAVAERSPGLVLLKVDRAWDRMRDDARFAALVRRVGIP